MPIKSNEKKVARKLRSAKKKVRKLTVRMNKLRRKTNGKKKRRRVKRTHRRQRGGEWTKWCNKNCSPGDQRDMCLAHCTRPSIPSIPSTSSTDKFSRYGSKGPIGNNHFTGTASTVTSPSIIRVSNNKIFLFIINLGISNILPLLQYYRTYIFLFFRHIFYYHYN